MSSPLPPIVAAPRSLRAWRVVESQSRVSTMKLVDDPDDQALLERLIDTVKPAPFPGTVGMHYLLATPFRHAPLRFGSRFGRPHEHGYWYGALELETAFAEVAYYLLRFFADMSVAPPKTQLRRTSFRAPVAAERFVALTDAPWDAHRASVSDPASYAVSQPLGTALVASGVQAVTWWSARRPVGRNVVVFDPTVFSGPPTDLREWVVTVGGGRLTVQPVFGAAATHRFTAEQFFVDGRLPAP